MLTRLATQKKLLEESSVDNSSTTDPSEGEFTAIFGTESETSIDTSLTCISYKDAMDESVAVLAAPTRKKVERLLSKTLKNGNKLATQRGEEDPSHTDLEITKEILVNLEQIKKEHEALSQELYEIEDNPTALEEDDAKVDEFDRVMSAALRDCKYLISQRSIYSTISSLETAVRGLTAAYETSPDNDHSLVFSNVSSRIKDLENDLHLSLMSEHEELRGKGNAMLERAYAAQGRVAGAKTPDVKISSTRVNKSNVKLKHIEIPSFSGRTEDWLSFKRLFFKAVHHNDDLDDDTRLTYLVQAMQDTRAKAEYRLDEPGTYRKILSELENEHDKPRWMHRRYCDQMKNLLPNPHTREGMKQLISQVNTILNGFIRLKGEDCRTILTSITEGVMDPELRALWNQRTDSKKTTPPIEELLQFIKDQADQMEEEPPTSTVKGWEKVKHRQGPKYKGTANSVVSPATNQQRGSQPKTNHRLQTHHVQYAKEDTRCSSVLLSRGTTFLKGRRK